MPLVEAFNRIQPDQWRRNNDFSRDVDEAQRALWASGSDDEAQGILERWISEFQPCLFGRIAARAHQLSYCFLRENELGDESLLRNKIQSARTSWKRGAWKGEKHGFLIVLLSERIARSTPSPELLELARRLCSLYLLVDVVPDQAYLDELFYEFDIKNRPVKQWSVGVNYFCSNGDGRWWRDHRIPGGMALSMNSVGHMVGSGAASNAVAAVARELGFDSNELPSKVASLSEALVLAMQTIKNSSQAISGKATALINHSEEERAEKSTDTAPLPQSLSQFSHRCYYGWYHTDWTLPRLYFQPDIERPPGASRLALDFSYLFDDQIENPDYSRMGQGLQIREDVVANVESNFQVEFNRRFAGRDLALDEVKLVKQRLGIASQL